MKSSNASLWTEEGYKLFAEEGPEGLQVERLSRILHLNKSGFYHYFGDFEGFYEDLTRMHMKKIDLYFDAVVKAETIDPDYFHILIDFKIPTMFHKQLRQVKNNGTFCEIAESLDIKEAEVLEPLWCRYLGVEDHPKLAMQYLDIVRDRFYERISFQNYTYEFLRYLIADCKMVIDELIQPTAVQSHRILKSPKYLP